MGLMPKRVKFRKVQRGKRRGSSSRGATMAFGEFGLKALENSYFTDRQIEASRVALMRNLKGGGKVWIRIFPDRPFTQKGAETPMGKGKGDPAGYVAEVLPGRIIFEIDGVTFAQAKEAIRKAGSKVSVRTRMVARGG